MIKTFGRLSAKKNLFRRLQFPALQVLAEARQYLHKVAGPVAKIKLVDENLVPGVAARAGRARQAENESRFRAARERAALDRGRSDLLHRYLMEDSGKALHLFL